MAMIFVAGCDSNKEEKVTVKTTIDDAAKQFLHNEFYASAYAAAVARARVYNAINKEKAEFANHLESFKEKAKDEVMKMAKGYYGKGIREDDHIPNIQNLCDKFGELSQKNNGIFEKNRFRFGSAQKLLNLYLKYLWVAGEITQQPPHCPFDRIVIHNIMADHFGKKKEQRKKSQLLKVKWTKLDWIDDNGNDLGYRSLVEYAKQCQGDYPSLAVWELAKFNEYRRQQESRE